MQPTSALFEGDVWECPNASISRFATRWPSKNRLLVIDHVPAEVCSNCGEISFTPNVVERLQKPAYGNCQPSKGIETNVYEFVRRVVGPCKFLEPFGPDNGK